MKAKDGGRGWVHVYPFNDESETGHAERRTHKGTIANGKKTLQDPLGKPESIFDKFLYFVSCLLSKVFAEKQVCLLYDTLDSKDNFQRHCCCAEV